MTKKIKYTRLFALPNGDSAFEDMEMVLGKHPDGEKVSISEAYKVDCAKFLSFKASAIFDLHTAPARQFLFVLRGDIEVEVSNSAKRTFHAGDVLLVEDTIGKGHITRILSKEDALVSVCPFAL